MCDDYKIIHDKIHGYISISKFAKNIIDTKFFQRLRDLSQLGACKYVFPNAVHTRFEHSIGTYYICNKLLNTIIMYTEEESIEEYLSTIPELKNYYDRMYDGKKYVLDKYICELIKIAALCHDIGHGPFSHVFDDFYLPHINKDKLPGSSHEERSGLIIDKIIKTNLELSKYIHDDEIQFIKNIISPEKKHIGFLYQIVSNNITGLDVDKFDYLQRDIEMIGFQAKIDVSRLVEHIRIINNNIVYPEQAIYDIYNLYQTRHRLHVEIYAHNVSIAVQYLLIELFKYIDEFIGLSDSIGDMDDFCNMTEGYVMNSAKILSKYKNIFNEEQQIKLVNALKIIDDIENRNLYAIVYSFKSKDKIDFTDLKELDKTEDNIIIFQHKIGFVSGNKPNPFNSIDVYKTKNSKKISESIEVFRKSKEKITMLMPEIYQEYINIIFYKDRTNVKKIEELKIIFKNY